MIKCSSIFRNFLILPPLLLTVFSFPVQSAIFRCSFDEADWFIVGRRYSCIVEEIQFAEVAEVTQILGDHMLGRRNAEVEAFRMLNNDLVSMLPRNIESFFPNLLVLDLRRSGLTSITAEDLSHWPDLSVFFAGSNEIEEIDGDLFQNSPRLSWIDFFNNLISNIGVNLLSNLNELTYVDFGHNPCINIWANTPEGIENLKAQLLAQCPPTVEPQTTVTESLTTEEQTTTESSTQTTTVSVSTSTDRGQCTARCSINEEVDELRERIENLERAGE